MSLFRYVPIFCQLLKTELVVFKESFFDKLLNSFIWTGTTIAITSYVLPSFGLSIEYGTLLAAGIVVGSAGFEIYPSVANFVADLEGDRHIAYHLTLPLPGWLLCVKHAVMSTLNALLMGIFTLISSKLILFNRFPLTALSYGKLLVIFLGYSFFFSFFTIWIISIAKSMQSLENTFMRIVYPLWICGGFQFTWYTLYSCSSTLGYAVLCNPYIYAIEAMRGAILGQQNFLPFWICMMILTGFTIFFGWLGIVKLKRRLDFI